jgi:hypothetical protein
VRVRLGTVRKEVRGALRVIVRSMTPLRVCKGALRVRASLWVALRVQVSLWVVLRVRVSL